jgi:hypothetical protein
MPLKRRLDPEAPPAVDPYTPSIPDPRELVIDGKTGRVRQAGAVQDEGKWILDLKQSAEQDLYVFTKMILKRSYLTPALHGRGCRFLQRRPPYRKMLLWPRKHAKTSVVGHGLPIHVLIQPKEHNVYLPGKDGRDTRILLACEKAGLAEERLRVIMFNFESNELLRALWPHCCWKVPRRDSKKWNESEIILPRPTAFGDPSIRTIGVDGAVTGARVDCAIKDDLISIEAANSAVVMQTAIDWHINTRALYESDDIPEFIIGTRWAVGDLYDYIMTEEKSVDVSVRSILEDGELIYPEKFTMLPEPGKTSIPDLQKEFGVLFWLLYMNSVNNSELTDFNFDQLRFYTIADGKFHFDEDGRDMEIKTRITPVERPVSDGLRGVRLTPEIQDQLFRRTEYLRFKT